MNIYILLYILCIINIVFYLYILLKILHIHAFRFYQLKRLNKINYKELFI